MALQQSRKTISERTGQDSVKTLTFGDMVVPLLSLLILLLLTGFVFIPMTLEALDLRDNIKEAQNKQEQLDEKLLTMKPLVDDKAVVQEDLKVARDVIPYILDVADFTYYVDQIAQGNNLRFQEISSGNIEVSRIGFEGESEFGANVRGVSGPIEYRGSYENIVNFLDQLQAESPFIVEASSIRLRRNNALTEEELAALPEGDENVEGDWAIEMDITGYYIAQQERDLTIDIYAGFIPYTNYQDVVAVFEEKSTKIQESEDNRLEQ
ncbi:MAG: hypothetical protein QY318_00745 [Candidatus Dojkabacteria bacterium]|nr:MAG: hypothetical protein QY318_00745 [Candidatus Dojkabacteria bacterium]